MPRNSFERAFRVPGSASRAYAYSQVRRPQLALGTPPPAFPALTMVPLSQLCNVLLWPSIVPFSRCCLCWCAGTGGARHRPGDTNLTQSNFAVRGLGLATKGAAAVMFAQAIGTPSKVEEVAMKKEASQPGRGEERRQLPPRPLLLRVSLRSVQCTSSHRPSSLPSSLRRCQDC